MSKRMMACAASALVALAPLTAVTAGPTPAAAHPARVVVGPHGSDHAAGTAAHPLRTVRAALRRLGGTGGLVLLRGGVYHQRVRLVGARHVTIEPYRHEHPVLS